jgi:lipopolysaccharide export system permease protein
MLNLYQKYIIKKFISIFFIILLIFFLLAFILGSLEEISFLKNSNKNVFFPYYLTLLNIPITLFEIFPFIFFLTTQYLIYDMFKKDEIVVMKINGLNNYSIIKLTFLIALFMGLFNITFFYHIASNLKFEYSFVKNNLSNDNKFLAMVTKSGLWIKDESDEKKLIIKSKSIKENVILNNIINEFDKDFKLIRVIKSDIIDIKNTEWLINNPIITSKNSSGVKKGNIILKTNFNYDRIKNTFSNVSTMSIKNLFKSKEDYRKIGYSTTEITTHLFKLFTTPFFYGILTTLASIIMMNFSKTSSIFFYISLGFIISVFIYYIMFFFESLANNGTIPVIASYIFPMMVLLIITIMGLVVNHEK